MTRSRRRPALLVATATFALAGCGETTVDTSITVAVDDGQGDGGQGDGASAAPATTPVDLDAPLAELIVALQAEIRGLDEQVVDNDGDDETLARIDAIWDVAEPQVQDQYPDLLFGFQQAVGLARTGVERRRPADASKGELLLGPLVDQLLAG